jgi:hypothetical protein
MIRCLMTTSAAPLIGTAGTTLAPQAAEAYPHCSALSYGIGNCMNQGWINRGFPPRNIRSNDNGGRLLEQPRFHPSCGGGYGLG